MNWVEVSFGYRLNQTEVVPDVRYLKARVVIISAGFPSENACMTYLYCDVKVNDNRPWMVLAAIKCTCVTYLTCLVLSSKLAFICDRKTD